MSKLITVRYFVVSRWLHRYRTRMELENFQNSMLKKHMVFLRKNSKYFQHIPAIEAVGELDRLPLMNKQKMMDNFDAMNTVNVNRDEAVDLAIESEKTRKFTKKYNGISVGLSSGTSGHRGLFITSDYERHAWAGTVLAKFLPRKKFFGHRVAFFLRANNNLYETVSSRFIDFRYFDIYSDMDENVKELSAYMPTVLVAPPSVLGFLADRMDTGDLEILPQKIISVAEVLNSRDESRFKVVFNQEIIFQAYQCTEGFLAYTCHKGTLHLTEDFVIFEKEYIDVHRFVPIITDFRRRSQPIVRYRLNDILVESTKTCECGSVMTAIDRIEGREDDVFIFKGLNQKYVRVFSDMIGRCILYASDICEYRVVQTDFDTIEVYIDRLNNNSKVNITIEFRKLARKLSFESPHITFKPYTLDFTKKLKRIERTFKIERDTQL